jgi:CheY-like chemotaxis protein
MAANLLDGDHRPGAEHLKSCGSVSDALHKNKAVKPGAGCVAAEEIMIGTMFANAGQQRRPETILLAEDEAFVRKVTAEILESAGYRLVITKSAAEALEAHRRCGPVDLLLADVVMPGMSGRELATEFESLCPRARVLLMSGYAEQLALCELSPYQKKYLAKPFSVRMLLTRVREVLGTNPFDGGAPA